ncbi:C-X-C chemokine receptor type 2 isoform X2 [Polypterus senegalus]|nr:C-X-C chemokine receptor type 2 isoform X2 [Polypterus senegalus]
MSLSDFEVLSVYEDSYVENESFIVDPSTIICLPVDIKPELSYWIFVGYLLIFLIAIPGNLMVAVVIGTNYRSLVPSDIYLFHLALADVFFALTIPFWGISAMQGWVFGNAMCKLISLIQEINFYSSILFLVCISIDRYLAIVWAVKTKKKRMPFFSWLLCIIVWLLGVILSLPVLHNHAFKPLNLTKTVCYEEYNPQTSDHWRFSIRMLRHVLGFLLPLTIMLICYGITVSRLLQTRSFGKQKAMKVIVSVVSGFLFCWMPYHIVVMLDTAMRAGLFPHTCEKRYSIDLALLATQSLGLLHSCINPFLYAFVGEKFKQNFLKFLVKTGLTKRNVQWKSSRSSSQNSDITSTMM